MQRCVRAAQPEVGLHLWDGVKLLLPTGASPSVNFVCITRCLGTFPPWPVLILSSPSICLVALTIRLNCPLSCEEGDSRAHRWISIPKHCKQWPLQVLSWISSEPEDGEGVLQTGEYLILWWERVFMWQAAFPGISLRVLAGIEAWGAAVGQSKMVVWTQGSEIYKQPLFPESRLFFVSSWNKEVVSLFVFSIDHLICALIRQSFLLLHVSLLYFLVLAAACAKLQPLTLAKTLASHLLLFLYSSLHGASKDKEKMGNEKGSSASVTLPHPSLKPCEREAAT